jgi:hypothetical protein
VAGHSTWSKLENHRVEPAGGLGAESGEFSASFTQHSEHLDVFLAVYYRQVRLAQRGDRYRSGIVGVVLV